MLGNEAAHRGIEFPQGGIGGSSAVGGGHLDLRQIGFQEEGPTDIHLREGCKEREDHLGAQIALRRIRNGPYLVLQPLVLGGKARLIGPELGKQAVGTGPSFQSLFALVQRLDQRLGLHMEDACCDQDAFDIGKNARMLEKTFIGDRGDDCLLVIVGHLRHIGFR